MKSNCSFVGMLWTQDLFSNPSPTNANQKNSGLQALSLRPSIRSHRISWWFVTNLRLQVGDLREGLEARPTLCLHVICMDVISLCLEVTSIQLITCKRSVGRYVTSGWTQQDFIRFSTLYLTVWWAWWILKSFLCELASSHITSP
jgi:hypothetical protein